MFRNVPLYSSDKWRWATIGILAAAGLLFFTRPGLTSAFALATAAALTAVSYTLNFLVKNLEEQGAVWDPDA